MRALQIEWPYRLVQFLGSTSLQGVQTQDVSCARIATGRGDRNQLATGAELQHGIGIGRTKSPTLDSLLIVASALGRIKQQFTMLGAAASLPRSDCGIKNLGKHNQLGKDNQRGCNQ